MSARGKKKAEPQGPVEQKALEPIVCIKGFDKDLRCRGFQYEIGKTYKHEGAVDCCASGFHSCEYPLDCFGYYEPGFSRYAIVSIGGATDKDGGDTKICSAEITIKAEIQIPEIVTRAIAWVISICKPAHSEHSEGDRSASSATGYRDENYRIVHIRASKVGENGIKADTWYALDASGEFVEAA